MTRRILRLDGGGAISVAQEARFDSEAQLHSAVAAHPEVLPAEDVGVGPLVALAKRARPGRRTDGPLRDRRQRTLGDSRVQARYGKSRRPQSGCPGPRLWKLPLAICLRGIGAALP